MMLCIRPAELSSTDYTHPTLEYIRTTIAKFEVRTSESLTENHNPRGQQEAGFSVF